MSEKIIIKKRQVNYVNNPDFLQALITYKQKCIENEKNHEPKPQIPNYIGECFIKIAEGLSHKSNFNGYTYRDEMVADGIENCLMYFENFNPEKSKNPFAYFTQIIYYAFLRRIQKEKKQQYVKYKATEQFAILDEFDVMENEDGTFRPFTMYENLSEFIQNFEIAKEETKLKKKEAKRKKEIDMFKEV